MHFAQAVEPSCVQVGGLQTSVAFQLFGRDPQCKTKRGLLHTGLPRALYSFRRKGPGHPRTDLKLNPEDRMSEKASEKPGGLS